FVKPVNVGYRAAVRNDITGKLPIVAEYLPLQRIACAARLTFVAIVGAHHRIRAALPNASFKRREVSVVEVALIGYRIKAMALGLRSAVNGIVLWRCYNFEVFRIPSLKPFDELHSHARRQIRIFAVGFLAAAPTRITKDVDVRAPEGQPLVSPAIAF